MDKVRFGVIGTGGMGSGHVKCVQELPDAELTCVCDIDPDVTRAKSEETGVPGFVDHLELLGSGLVDAVTIATPHYDHPPIAVDAPQPKKIQVHDLVTIIIRESRIQNYQPTFRCPMYPWLPILGIIGYIFIIYQMGIQSLLITFLFGIFGFMVYWFYGRTSAEKEYALLHLVERIISQDLLLKGKLETYRWSRY